ncbi:fumarylacetoacetate hydrolase family protein [Niveispirillum sp. KHB5.9]|uniref:fumarylacetoacetate hydrolase family protein n=1 Tax=Niveispirillum sp. KHB5.9 TaxID=3400269 RepID=UPI003A87AE32
MTNQPFPLPDGGTVYGVVLNTKTELARLGDSLSAAPYKAPPKAPVLYIKPRNTRNRHGGLVTVPAATPMLEVNATLAVLIGRPATRVAPELALDHVAGYTLAIDVCEPHDSYYRPAIRQRCRDGFLPVGPLVVPAAAITDPDALEIAVSVNGVPAARWSTADLVRPLATLIADVSGFMTLAAGDLLLVGLAPDPALARAGDKVTASIAGIGELTVTLEGEI